MRYVEPIGIAMVFMGLAYHKALEMIDSSTTLGVIASFGVATCTGILVTFAGASFTALSNNVRR